VNNPLLLLWRVALGAGVGTILGLFAGLSLFGSSTAEGAPLLDCIGVGSLAGGVVTWLWERWKERAAIAAARPNPFVPLPRKEDDSEG
jgi:hypothetical protein